MSKGQANETCFSGRTFMRRETTMGVPPWSNRSLMHASTEFASVSCGVTRTELCDACVSPALRRTHRHVVQEALAVLAAGGQNPRRDELQTLYYGLRPGEQVAASHCRAPWPI